MTLELRFRDAEVTAGNDGSMTVAGYVNVANEQSRVMGRVKKFIEKIPSGVFQTSLDRMTEIDDIDFLAEHDKSKILASTRNGSLILREDSIGLYMEATIAPTSWGKDYYELINAGILKNLSFGFRTIRDTWRALGNGLLERTILELQLTEVSVVKNPAYSQSTVGLRGIDVIEDPEIPQNILEEEELMNEKMFEALSSLEGKISKLITAIEVGPTSLRSLDEKPAEEVIPPVVEPEPEVEPEVIEEVIEEDKEPEPTPELEPEVIEDEVVEEEVEEEEEQKRSITEDFSAALMEFRSELQSLREGEKQ